MPSSPNSIRTSACLFLLACLLITSCNNTPAAAPGGAAGAGGGGRGGRGGFGGPVSVAVAPVVKQDVPIYLNGLGTVTAFNTVAVRSRIDGQLVDIRFNEGDVVKQGQLLAKIDSRPYEAQLAQTQAQLFKDQATLRDAKLNLERYNSMVKDGIIAPQQRDTQQSLVDQLDGTTRSDQAQIDTVKLNIAYCSVPAPITGRVGLRQVDVGNMIHASDQNPIIVITQLQPIAVIFTLPEDLLPSVSKHMKNGTLHVDAYDRGDQLKLASGTLVTIDNAIDTTTGTAKLKAVFDNKNNELWPNQFVNIHMLIETRKDAIVVPTVAIQRGPQGVYTYVMKADKSVEMRPVKIGITQGNSTIIDEGLTTDDTVIVDGQDKLSPASKVEPRSPAGAGGPGSGGPGGGGGRGGHKGGGTPGADAGSSGRPSDATASDAAAPHGQGNRQGNKGGGKGGSNTTPSADPAAAPKDPSKKHGDPTKKHERPSGN